MMLVNGVADETHVPLKFFSWNSYKHLYIKDWLGNCYRRQKQGLKREFWYN